jgi:tetratricopeptide (TPR) repeat protein
MNNTIKYLLVIILTGFCFGCERDLMDKMPLDKFSETSVWQDLNLTEAYVNNQYRVLPKLGWYEWIRAHQLSCFTDEATHKYGYHGIHDYWGGNMGPSIPTGIDTWEFQYEFIKGCNEFLQNIADVPAESDEQIALKSRMEGEIYTLRAWSYMDLAVRYDGAVLVTEPFELDSEFDQDRATFEETVELVLADLEKAIPLLPESYADDSDWGRITQGAAMAIKSRMLLYAASPLFNESNDLSKWQAAAAAAKAVIDLELYRLIDGDYETAQEDYKRTFLDIKNDEVILTRGNDPVNPDGYFEYFKWAEAPGGGIDGAGYCQGWSSTMANQDLVDAFEMNDGTPFDWNNPTHAADPYANRDPRFYSSITHDGSKWVHDSLIQFWIAEESNNYTLDPLDPSFVISNTAYGRNSIGNPTKKNDCPELSYINQKHMDYTYDFEAEQYSAPVSWHIIRYAEILLNYAEASFEAGDESTALTYLNMVRERADMPPVSASGNDLRLKIWHERRIELCFEAHRFFDARRWKIAHIVFNNPIKGIRIVKDQNSDTKVYNIFEYEQRSWPEKYYFQPIPQDELDRATLRQNPGY